MNELMRECLESDQHQALRNRIHKLIRSSGEGRRRLRQEQKALLGSHYTSITQKLNLQFETIQTSYERTLIKMIKEHTKLKIYSQVWIGRRCCDIFIPNVRAPFGNKSTKTAKGLVLEVDGPIHNNEAKMKKDQSKERLLHSMNILTVSIPNEDLREDAIRRICLDIRNFSRISSRETNRLWSEIHMETLFGYGSADEISQIFPEYKDQIYTLWTGME